MPQSSLRDEVHGAAGAGLERPTINFTHQRVFLPSPLGRRVGDEGLRDGVSTLSVQARDDFAKRIISR